MTPALQERFVAAYQAVDGQVQLEIFPDEPHVFPAQAGPAAERAIALMKDFIAHWLNTPSAGAAW